MKPMCLANPAKIERIEGETAIVEIDGVKRSAVVSFVDDPKVGDYVLLHAGFAIRKWSEEDVKEFRTLMNEIEQKAQATEREEPGKK